MEKKFGFKFFCKFLKNIFYFIILMTIVHIPYLSKVPEAVK